MQREIEWKNGGRRQSVDVENGLEETMCVKEKDISEVGETLVLHYSGLAFRYDLLPCSQDGGVFWQWSGDWSGVRCCTVFSTQKIAAICRELL